MKDDRIDRVFGAALDGWSELDTDWQGLLVAAAIACLVGVGVPIPW
jgi:hypothetical protein